MLLLPVNMRLIACPSHPASGIPTGLAVASGLRKLKVQFNPPSPDAAVYYEYTVRTASGTPVSVWCF